MKFLRLYDDLAHLWPLISPPEHYEAEAAALIALIDRHNKSKSGRRLGVLELGVGGGHTLVYLADHYDCTAVDISEPMLVNCRRLVPQAATYLGDMRSVRLGRTFDAVFIHDAIDYMLSEADVRQALQTAAAHLEHGGLCVIAPTYTRENFVDGDVASDCNSTDNEQLTYFSYVHDPNPTDDIFEMILIYLIRDMRTREVQVIEDRHTCGLFSNAQWLEWMTEAGFKVRHEANDTGEEELWTLFIGVKKQ